MFSLTEYIVSSLTLTTFVRHVPRHALTLFLYRINHFKINHISSAHLGVMFALFPHQLMLHPCADVHLPSLDCACH
jgi:hypothetical protein